MLVQSYNIILKRPRKISKNFECIIYNQPESSQIWADFLLAYSYL